MAYAPPAPFDLPDRLAQIFEGLFRSVATRGTKNPAAGPLLALAWTRLRRLSARFAALVADVQAGRLPAARSERRRPPSVAGLPPGSSPGSGSDAPPPAPRPALPRGFGWLLRLVPEAAMFGEMVLRLIEDP